MHKKPWDPRTTSIETFWKQHTDGKDYTANCTKGKIDDDRLILDATANIRADEMLLRTSSFQLPILDLLQEQWLSEDCRCGTNPL